MTMATRRRAARSGSVPCPICGQKRLLVEHHIHGREIPDAEKSWNKAYVCAGCHDEVHAGRIVVEGWVMTDSGLVLEWHKAGEGSETVLGPARPPLYGGGCGGDEC